MRKRAAFVQGAPCKPWASGGLWGRHETGADGERQVTKDQVTKDQVAEARSD